MNKRNNSCNTMIDLSIIVLSYNQEDTITTCLDSILLSSTHNVELIICDDGSKDLTLSMEKSWSNNHKDAFRRVVILESEYNSGTVKNMVRGVKASHGEYIKCIGGDDFFTPRALDYIIEFTRSHIFDAAFSPIKMLIDGKQFATLSPVDIKHFFDLSSEERFQSLLLKNHIHAPSAFFSRTFWDKLELDKQPLVLVEDWYMWTKGISCECRYLLCATPLVIYNRTSKSASRSTKTLKMYLKDIGIMYLLIYKMRPQWIPTRLKLVIISMGLMLKFVSTLPAPLLEKANRVIRWRMRKS